MSDVSYISLLLIIANVFVSYKGFKDRSFYNRYSFEVEKVLIHKDYIRILTSGFLHTGWLHLIFNMLSLYAFSSGIEFILDSVSFLLIYFIGIVGGNLFSLFIHRNHNEYSSVGASGGVCAVIFASIALLPQLEIGFFLLPLSIPAWIFGLIYVLFSIYGIRSKRDNIGHEAHLAGAVLGMVIALIIEPSALRENYLPILAVLLPSLFFILMIIKKPHFLLIDNNYYRSQHKLLTVDQRYNAEKINKQQEIDAILEKIHKKGMKSLTKKEKDALAAYSSGIR
ncbi:MAG: rhomboid family intramembrane serine protease [Flavisolibacter sp.]